jgi:hypothetical protein
MKFRRPFAAFRILVSGGEQYLVQDRFQFAVGLSELTYVYPDATRSVRVGADQIVGVELVEQKAA